MLVLRAVLAQLDRHPRPSYLHWIAAQRLRHRFAHGASIPHVEPALVQWTFDGPSRKPSHRRAWPWVQMLSVA